MVQTTFFCDRCRAVIEPGERSELAAKFGPWRAARPRLDLCRRGLDALGAFLDAGAAGAKPGNRKG